MELSAGSRLASGGLWLEIAIQTFVENLVRLGTMIGLARAKFDSLEFVRD